MARKSNTLTQERLQELLHYDPETGHFTWLKWRRNSGQKRAGTREGGYIRIKIDGKSYRAHRLAWLYIVGAFPALQVDHADGDGFNNRWNNLREATASQNMGNRRRGVNNETGVKGVYRKDGKFAARIANTHLGTFETIESAAMAYAVAAREVFGEFARIE